MIRGLLVLVLFLVWQSEELAGQSAGGHVSDWLRRPGPGTQLLSSGLYGGPAGGVQADFAASHGWQLGRLVLGLNGHVARGRTEPLSGGAGLELSVPAGRSLLRLMVASGATRDEHGGPSVTTLGARLERSGVSLSIHSNVLPGIGARYRDTVVATQDTFQRVRILDQPGQPRRLYADAELGYTRAIDRLAITAAVGQRIGIRQSGEWWARAGGEWALNGGVALGMVVGRDAGSPWRGRAAGPVAAMFVRIATRRAEQPSPQPTRFAAIESIRIESDAVTRFTIVAPEARSVEVAGDFSGWSPHALRLLASGVWQIELPLAPGLYHISVRVNGGPWRPPPGLPSVPDELGGETGLFSVGGPLRVRSG